MYGWGAYRGGLGVLDYYGLLKQANLQNCDPMDSTCVTNNVAKQAAVEDLWASKYQTTGAPDDLKLNFSALTPSQVKENYDPTNPFWGGNVIDTRGIMTATSSDPVRPPSSGFSPPAAPPSSCGPAPVAPSGLNPAAYIQYTEDLAKYLVCSGAKPSLDTLGVTVKASPVASGAKIPVDSFSIQNASAPGAVDAGDGSLWSSIPWWGWLVGAGGLYFAFGGKR